MTHAITVPMITRLVSVSLIFVIFGFSPVMFPAGQLPGWLAQVNRWLSLRPPIAAARRPS